MMFYRAETILTNKEKESILYICNQYPILYNKYRDIVLDSWHYSHVNSQYILDRENIDIDYKIIDAIIENIKEYKNIKDKAHLNIYNSQKYFRIKNVKLVNSVCFVNDIELYFDNIDKIIDWSSDIAWSKTMKLQLIGNRLIAICDKDKMRIRKQGKHEPCKNIYKTKNNSKTKKDSL